MANLWETFLNFREVIWTETLTTLYMTFTTVGLAYLLGLPLGVLIVCLNKGGLFPNKPIHAVLGFVVNTVRSIPFLILMVALMTFTRFVVGTGIGSTAALVPLIIAAAPFIARMVEAAINEVDVGVIDAAKSMGATNLQIICKVMLPESIPSLIRGFSITAIMIMNFSAMTGAIAAGGLGDMAIRYGHMRSDTDVIIVIVVVIVIIVTLIQLLFNFLAAKIDKRIIQRRI
ncbi:MAG: ABC transporter permease [Defluviitaleaceae bacterium]|nr:ABC transporter permease [Defluviitaleaceae bacterium]